MFVGTSWMSFTGCSQIPESGHMADGVRVGVYLPEVAPTVQLPPVYRSRCRHMRSLTGVLRTSPPGGDPRRPGAVALRLTRGGSSVRGGDPVQTRWPAGDSCARHGVGGGIVERGGNSTGFRRAGVGKIRRSHRNEFTDRIPVAGCPDGPPGVRPGVADGRRRCESRSRLMNRQFVVEVRACLA
jgi:hypothetical protein